MLKKKIFALGLVLMMLIGTYECVCNAKCKQLAIKL